MAAPPQLWQPPGVQVLVTGAGGFVGTHLLPRLAASGHETRAVDREVDVTDAEAVSRTVRTCAPDGLVHLAGVSSVAASLAQPLDTWRTNFVGARNVFEAVRRHAPACHVLLVGSGEVYGLAVPGAAPFDESSPLAPRSPYAAAKACSDRLAGAYARLGLRVARLRPFNHTGPGQRDTFAAGSFARQLAAISRGEQEPRVRVGNLDSTRDFLDVADVVEAYTRILETGAEGIFNVASGHGRSIAELLEGLVQATGLDVAIEVDPARVRPTDASIGDASRLQAATGWRPQVPFQETLTRMVAHAMSRQT